MIDCVIYRMEPLFAEAHGTLEQISTLFMQLERHLGHADEVQIEETIQKKLEEIQKYGDNRLIL